MKIRVQDGLPYVAIAVAHRGRRITLDNVLLDTGSAGTVLSVDQVLTIGLQYEADDFVHRIRGVGGAEFVFTKRADEVSLGELLVSDFEVEVGAMEYGFPIDGILGMDFLTKTGAVIDLAGMEVHTAMRS